MARPVGALIDNRYEVRRYLGSGSFGEVYEVLDRHQDVIVALKFLRSLPGGAMWEEAQILTRLESEYILRVRNATFDSGVPFLVTDLAFHGSADAPMSPVGVSPGEAVRWLRAACRGAARTHAAQLLHRDIKPANIFLRGDGQAMLGDFGIAVLMDAAGRAACGGTAQTMAPEVAAGGQTTIASDVYSLGATLYALLAGRYAHDGPTGPACMANVVNGSPPALRDVAPHVSQALAQRVAKAMARDPVDRYPSAAAFDAALGSLPEAERQWQRTDEHPTHQACWRGTAAGKSGATVCLVLAGRRAEVLAQHQPTRRRITAACRPPAPPSAWSRNLRAAMAAVP
jgi:serine/threonine protein kinase